MNLESRLPLTISAQDGLISQTEFFDKQVASKNISGYYLIENGEFAYNKSYSNGYPWGAIKRLDKYKNGVLSTLYIVFKPIDVDSQFLVSYFDTTFWHSEIAEIAVEGARNHGLLNIPVMDFFRIKIKIPKSKEEQTQIGNFFKQLDDTIALHQRELEKFKILKTSYLEHIFLGKVSLFTAKNTITWEQRKLGEFGISTSGTSLENEFLDSGKYKVISIGSYSENSIYTDQGIRVNKTNKTESKILRKNDLTMILNDKTASGNIIGRVLLIDADESYVYNQRTQRIETDQSKFVPEFLYQLLNANNIRKKIILAAQGNTQIYVNWSSIRNISYLVPKSKEEQTQIGNFFKQLDDTIALHQKELAKYQQIKAACLEKMFVE